MPIPYSLFDRVNQTQAPTSHHAETFRAWVEGAVGADHATPPTKDAAGLFSPCLFDGPRSAASVGRNAPIFVADADDYTEDQFLATLDRLEGLTYAVISSWSHLQTKGTQGPKIRVRWLLLCDQDLPTDPREYRATWESLNVGLFDGALDPGAKDVAHLYYKAACPAGSLQDAVWHCQEGAPYALGDRETIPQGVLLLEAEAKALEARETVEALELEKVFAGWKSARNRPTLKALGVTGLALLAGEPFAKADRHNTLRALTKALAQEVPEAITWQAESLADLFAASLAVTGDPADLIDPQEVIDLFEGAIEKFREAAAGALEGKRSALQDQIAATYPDRGGELMSPEEIAAFCDARRCTPDLMDQQLLLNSGQQIYVSTPDGGILPTPVSRATVAGEGLRSLSVFYPLIDPSEVVPWSELLRRHAMTISGITYDYNAPRATFDPYAKDLLLPAAQSRRSFVDPQPHKECLDWIDLIDAHNGNSRFKDWLSSWDKLDKATAAVVAFGGADSGKTLPAFAMAEMYGTTPVNIDHATGDFPWPLVQCPLVLGDETMGRAYYKSGSEFLRREITHPTRQVNRKFHDQAELRGFLRFWFAVNDLEVLATNEDLNNASIDAFGERLALVQFPTASRDYLQAIGGRDHIEAEWKGKGSKLLETIAWLGETWESQSKSGRFYMAGSGEGSEFSKLFRSSQGSRHDVLMWLYAFLGWSLESKRGEMSRFGYGDGLIMIEGGELLVTAEALVQNWDHAFKTNPPPPRVVQKAIQGLSSAQVRRKTSRGGNRRYNVIPASILEYRANLSSLGVEGVRDALAKGSIHLADTTPAFEADNERIPYEIR